MFTGAVWLCLAVAAALGAAPLRVALILPESGPNSAVGRLMRAGFELGIGTTANDDRPAFVTTYYDNHSSPDSAAALGRMLLRSRAADVWAGGYPSGCAAELAVLSREEGVPYIIIASSADSLTVGYGETVFRLGPPASDYNDGLVAWTSKVVGVEQRLAVLRDGSVDWSPAAEDLRRDLAPRWRGDILTVEFSAGESTFAEGLRALKRFKPAAVWLIGGTADIARFLRRCRENDWAPYGFIVGTTPLVSRRFISAAAGAADFTFAPAVWWWSQQRPEAEGFTRTFIERYGSPPDYHAAESYVAAQVLTAAARRIRKGTPPVEALQGTDIRTVIGRVRFSNYRAFINQNRVQTVALQLRQFDWKVVHPPNLATDRYVYPVPDWRQRARDNGREAGHHLFNLVFMVVTAFLLITAWLRRKKLLGR